jgi:hypothetical protein
MTRVLFFVAALATTACAASPEAINQLTKAEKKAGWVLLFDGSSLEKWQDPRKLDPNADAWTVEDGAIKANAHHRITEDLFSNETYTDFELQWDWRIAPGGNSGVKYRIQRTVWLTSEHPKLPRFEDQVQWFLDHPLNSRPQRGQNYVIGLEYQMIDNAANADALLGPSHSAAALYDMVGPTQDATRPVGQWNHSLLRVQGDRVEHWMNGVKVVDTSIAPDQLRPRLERRWGKSPGVFELLADQPRRDCPISLQNHDSDTWFRSIKVRRLPAGH